MIVFLFLKIRSVIVFRNSTLGFIFGNSTMVVLCFWRLHHGGINILEFQIHVHCPDLISRFYVIFVLLKIGSA